MTDRLTIRRPDDWHVHLRDGAMLDHVARYTARQFARAISCEPVAAVTTPRRPGVRAASTPRPPLTRLTRLIVGFCRYH